MVRAMSGAFKVPGALLFNPFSVSSKVNTYCQIKGGELSMSWSPLPEEGSAFPKESIYSFGNQGFGYNAPLTGEKKPSSKVTH